MLMTEMNRSTQYWCVGCMKPKEKTGFIQSLNPHHNKYLPLCRACIGARYDEYHKELKSEGAALWCLCAEMGYPVIREYYDMAMSRRKDTTVARQNLFMLYHNTLKEMGFVIEGFWQSDMMLDEFIDINSNKSEFDKKEKDKILDSQQLERIWGKFEPDEYELLENFFETYIADIPEMETALELRYRDLCKAELRKRKADESGDVAEIEKAQKNLKTVLDMLNLNDFAKKETDERLKFIDRLAWMIEETEPCEEEDEAKYRDVAGYEKAFDNIMRSMKNLNGKVRTYPPVPEEEQ